MNVSSHRVRRFTEQVGLKVDAETLQAIDAAALSERRTRASWLRVAIERALAAQASPAVPPTTRAAS